MPRRNAPLIANIRPALDEPAPIAGTLAWYVAAVIVLVVLLIGLGWSSS